MRTRAVLVALLFAVVLVTVACQGGKSTLRLADNDQGGTFKVERGGKVVITLESNASTGFSWKVNIPAEPQLVLDGEPRYLEPRATGSPVVGAPGKQEFTFRAEKTGRAVLQLAYTRSDGVPDRLYEVTVTVE